MYRVLPPGPTRFALSTEERDLILTEVLRLRTPLRREIESGHYHRDRWSHFLGAEDCEDLLDEIAMEAAHGVPESLRADFRNLYERLMSEEAFAGRTALLEERIRETCPDPDANHVIKKNFYGRHFENPDDANVELEVIQNAYNRTGRAELQGLSPVQVMQLTYQGWDSPDSAVRLNEDISAEAVAGVEIVHNARIFLKAVEESGGVKATQAGNLPRTFLLRMLETMRWPDGYAEPRCAVIKRLTEVNLFRLHTLRIVLRIAGLIRNQKGVFKTTRKGAELCREGAGNTLFLRLFRTYFVEFNLDYMGIPADQPEIQRSISYSLCVLQQGARDWREMEEFAPRLLLPVIRRTLRRMGYVDLSAIAVQSRILDPLERFGLVEYRHLERKEVKVSRLRYIRVTPLFDSFIQVQLADDWTPIRPRPLESERLNALKREIEETCKRGK